MSTIRKAVTAAAIALTLTASHAQFIDGNRLHGWLTSKEPWENSAGTTYVLGVYDTAKGSLICPPAGASLSAGQLSDMVRLNLIRRPEERHQYAYLFVVATLGLHWPCPQKGSAL